MPFSNVSLQLGLDGTPKLGAFPSVYIQSLEHVGVTPRIEKWYTGMHVGLESMGRKIQHSRVRATTRSRK